MDYTDRLLRLAINDVRLDEGGVEPEVLDAKVVALVRLAALKAKALA